MEEVVLTRYFDLGPLVKNAIEFTEIIIKTSLCLAAICFLLAGVEHMRSRTTKADLASLERSLLVIALGICLAIVFLFSWTFLMRPPGNFGFDMYNIGVK